MLVKVAVLVKTFGTRVSKVEIDFSRLENGAKKLKSLSNLSILLKTLKIAFD